MRASSGRGDSRTPPTLDDLEKELPLGQVAAISESRLSRVRAEDDVPERMPESVHEY